MGAGRLSGVYSKPGRPKPFTAKGAKVRQGSVTPAKRGLLMALMLAAAAVDAAPQAYPVKPMRWIVPFPAGGPADLVARLVGPKLADSLAQPVVIDNRPGAGSNIGMELAAKSPADGYTLLFVVPSLVTNPFLYKLNFDPARDLAPVAQLTNVSFVLLASPAFAPRTLAEIVGWAKARPRELTCATAGALPELACYLLGALGRIELTRVPYKGNAPALTDVIGGQVNIVFDAVNTALPQVKAGRVRALATSGARRSPFLPDLPTLAEALPGFEMTGWQGIAAPAGTPRAIVARLNREIGGVLAQPDVRQRLTDAGLEVTTGTPEQFAEFIRAEHTKYERLIREAGIKAE